MYKKIAALLLLTVMFFTTFSLGLSGIVQANPENKGFIIYMKNETFNPEKNSFDLIKLINNLFDSKQDLYIVQFKGPVENSWKEDLTRHGALIGDYVPDFAFIIKIDNKILPDIENLPFVSSVTPFKNEWKISKELLNSGEVQVPLIITLFPGTDREKIREKLQNLGGLIESQGLNQLKVILKKTLIKKIASDSNVMYIEKTPKYTIFNNMAAGVVQATEVWPQSLEGQGQVIGVADTGLDTGKNDSSMHLDFQGRIKAIYALARTNDASDPHGHGTHVAGSILGSGARSNGSFKGMAPKAQLVFQSIGDNDGSLMVGSLEALLGQAFNAGARIHSNSWGGEPDGAYDSGARQVDNYVWKNDMTVLFAAGNSGDENGDGKTDYGTIASPGTAKNVITVGASENNRSEKGYIGDNINQVAYFSSRGNTKDGRLKPDVVAPGTFILSTKSSRAPNSNFSGVINEYYGYMSGTSMATPITAGSVALIRQYFMDKLGVTPKPSLLKAALINGAADMGYGYPSRDQGWGRVDLKNTLYPDAPKEMKFDNESTALTTGQNKEYTYQVESSQFPLKVSLVWTDYPGSTTASKALVNDLDLQVISPSGKVYNGNDFASPFNDTVDRLNNVENVFIKTPEVGTYKVTVKAYNIPNGPQDYSLVTTADFGTPATPTPAPQPQPTPQPQPQPEPQPAPEPQFTTITETQTGFLEQNGSVTARSYYIDVTAPGNIKLDLTWASTADLNIQLYDPSGVKVAESLGQSRPETLTFNAAKLGRYRARVMIMSGKTNYIYKITHNVDPDKTAVVTKTDTVNKSGTGIKTYSITVGAAGTINIELPWVTTSADLDVYLYNSAGTLLRKAISADLNPETLSYIVSQPGTYKVKVVAYSGSSSYNLKIVHPK